MPPPPASAAVPLGPITEADLAELGLSEELVTGDAVVLALRPASFASRALAQLLDLLLLAGLTVGLIILLAAAAGGLDAAAASATARVLLVGLLVGLPVTVETVTRGRSLGKLAAGLRVVRDDGGPVRFRQALVRGLCGLVELYLFGFSIALIASLSNARGKRVGDLLAGTYVVRERTGTTRVGPVQMPAGLRGWAESADLGRVPDRLAVAARSFLTRAPALNPASRLHLANGLAEQLGRYVAPAPPAGTPQEAFIAAVLAERYRRDLERLTRQAQARAGRDQDRRSASPLSTAGTRLLGED
jgi:uncharacterized RDD family membrane protein YckC